ncbi:hypothetical protein R3P38DRAFT_3547629, partial [Favolaschia claudopus]
MPPPRHALTSPSLSLASAPKTAVIVGWTASAQGIARRLAQLGCARIIVCVDSNGDNGEGIIPKARQKTEAEIVKEVTSGAAGVEVSVIHGDLSDVKGIRAVVASIKAAVGHHDGAEAGIDYLVLAQISAPTGSVENLNAEGHDPVFTAQCIARFAIPYLLASSSPSSPHSQPPTTSTPTSTSTKSFLAPTAVILSIYYHWGHTLDDLTVEDLSLKRIYGEGKLSTTNMYKTQMRRDCTVLDGINEEFNLRFPQYRYYSLFPSLVKGDFNAREFPTYLKAVVWLGSKLAAVSPEEFAHAPVYLLASPPSTLDHTVGSDRFLDHGLNCVGDGVKGQWVRNRANTEKLWAKMVEIVGVDT